MGQYKLTQYEATALSAATLAANGMNPAAAWDVAAEKACGSASTAKKGCPRSTFLGLATVGAIAGVPPGKYSRTSDNASYAMKALQHLRLDESLADRPEDLWRRVMNGDAKAYNQQMHVVAALWRAKKIVRHAGA